MEDWKKGVDLERTKNQSANLVDSNTDLIDKSGRFG
jgi:hypothetical protein